MGQTTIPLFKVVMAPGVADAVAKTLASGMVTEGPRVLEFEDWLASYLAAPGILAVNSGTSALHLAAILLDLKPGDEVISTPITCAATSLALLHAGATIVWADVNPRTGLIDPVDVARKRTWRTRAVMAVDWAGALCAFDELAQAARAPVIEDAAHAFGAIRHQPLHIGPQPHAVCWSFQAIKHLTTGDGGAIFVNSEVQRRRARLLRWFGIDRQAPGPNIDKPVMDVGFKYHMNDIAATIGLANRSDARAAVYLNRVNAEWYCDNLRGIPGVVVPDRDPNSAWWLYTLILEDPRQRDFIEYMKERGIECSRVHSRNDRQPVFAPMARSRGGRDPGMLPGVDWFDSHQVAIPVGCWIGTEERERIAEAVRAWGRG